MESEVAEKQALLDALSPHDDQRASTLNELAKALRNAFFASGNGGLLEQSVDILHEAIRISEGRPGEQARYLNNIGIFLSDCATKDDEPEYLEQSITYLSQARQRAGPDLKCTTILNLANSLRQQYEVCNISQALDDSIALFEEALLEETSPLGRPKLLNGLCAGLMDKYHAFNEENYLERACSAGKQAVEESDDEHPFRATFLDTYSSALYSAFRRDTDTGLLIEAINYGYEAIAIGQGSFQLPLFYTNLAASLLTLYRARPESCNLDKVIVMLESAHQTFPDGHSHAGYCTLLHAKGLRYRFERDGSDSDIRKCCELLRALIDQTPPDHRLFEDYRAALGCALIRNYDLTGSVEDLDLAVNHLKTAINNLPSSGAQVSAVLGDLGVALVARFEARGSSDDIHQAEIAYQRSLESLTETSPDYTLPIVGLANVRLRSYQEMDRNGADLDSAIELYQDALSRDFLWESLRCARLATLAYALQTRYDLTSSEADWDTCILSSQEALALSLDSPGNGHRSHCLGQLGNASLQRYQSMDEDSRRPDHLDEAISNLSAALDGVPDSHPFQAMFQNNLGLSYDLRYRISQSRLDYNSAIAAYRAAMNVNTASPLLRTTAAYRGLVLVGRDDLLISVEFAEKAVELLPLLSPRVLQRSDQEHMISMFSGIGTYSAAIMLENQSSVTNAIRALETSRGIMNSALIETRTEFSALEGQHPELASNFEQLRNQLDSSGSWLAASTGGTQTLNMHSEHRLALSKAFDTLVKHIRTLQGFQSFLRPPMYNDLQSLLPGGFIVLINVSSFRSDALMVGKEHSIYLPDLRLPEMADRANAFIRALSEDNSVRRRETNDCIREVLSWLWRCLVRPVYAYLQTQTAQRPIRVCWIPIGTMAVFPIHAATDIDTEECALDILVSSYGTTLKEIQYARQHRKPGANPNTALLAYMTETPNLSTLRYAADEATGVAALLANHSQTTILKEPSKTDILSHIDSSAIVHLSCHGFADAANPSASRIYLHDWQIDPLTVADIAARRLPSAQMAYLSACHAAVGRAAVLQDEGIHLAGAFQIAGFPRVVGTLWQVDDRRAMEVSRRVWASLLGGDGGIEYERLAESVNAALRWLREKTKTVEVDGIEMEFEENDPFIWAPIVYVGL